MPARARWIPFVCASLATALLTSGCFRGPRLSPVTGTVTLDGEPLADAQVEFQPTGGAPPSYGTTDALGQYKLRYTKEKLGAVVGTHIVRIMTQTTAVDPETGEEYQIPQRVPEKYNYRSELVRQVTPEPNVINFDLESEPEEEQPPEKVLEEEKPEAKPPGTQPPEAEAPGVEQPGPDSAKREVPAEQAARPERAEVSGTVILNGEPLAGAKVEFQPREGPPSYGTTDQNGRYELMFTSDDKGAVVGTHTVRITTASKPVDPETKRIDDAKLVPPRYGVESELSVEVLPGKNTFDFDLGT